MEYESKLSDTIITIISDKPDWNSIFQKHILNQFSKNGAAIYVPQSHFRSALFWAISQLKVLDYSQLSENTKEFHFSSYKFVKVQSVGICNPKHEDVFEIAIRENVSSNGDKNENYI